MVDRADKYVWADADIVFGEEDLEGIDIPKDDDEPEEETEKSYFTTQAGFLSELRTLVKSAVEGSGYLGRYSFGIRMRELMRDYGLQAYKDGMMQGGVFVDELDDEDDTDYKNVFVDQAQYIGGFSDDLYVKKAITLNNLDMRVNMWGKSLEAFVDSGRVTANANGMYEWKYGMAEHCKDCLRLNGQIHRMKSWYASGWLPRASTLDCHGFNCKCELIKSNEKARGRF